MSNYRKDVVEGWIVRAGFKPISHGVGEGERRGVPWVDFSVADGCCHITIWDENPDDFTIDCDGATMGDIKAAQDAMKKIKDVSQGRPIHGWEKCVGTLPGYDEWINGYTSIDFPKDKAKIMPEALRELAFLIESEK